VDIILVKFTFLREDLIPAGIHEVERPNDAVMDMLHMREAIRTGAGDRAFVGRAREGRVDTADVMMQTGKPVHAAMLRRGLANNGYRMRDIHWFVRRDKVSGNVIGYVVNAQFERAVNGVSYPEHGPATIEALRALSRMTWGRSFHYDNRNVRDGQQVNLTTLNFTELMEGAQPQKAVTVRRGQVVTIDVASAMSEEEENKAS
jgi:hypothetical protein